MGYIGAGISRFNTVNGLSVNADGPTVTGIKDEDNMASNSAVKLATQQSIKAYVDSQIGANNELSEVLANGNTTGGNDISFADNDKAIFGAGSDLQVYHDASDSHVVTTNGNLNLQVAGGGTINLGDQFGNTLLKVVDNADVKLYHGTTPSEKLATTSTGIDVTGTVTADELYIQSTSNDSTVNTIQLAPSTTTNVQGGLGVKSGGIIDVNGVNSVGLRVGGTRFVNVVSGGDISFYDSTGVSQGLFWDASTQRLGINTTAPTKALHVDGGASSIAARFSYNGSVSYIQFENDTLNNGYIGYDNSGNLELWSGGSERVNITSDGNVNIKGTDNRPLAITSFNTVSNGAGWDLDATSGNGVVSISTSGTERMRVDSSGNLLVAKTSATTTDRGVVLRNNGEIYATQDGDKCLVLNRKTSDGQIASFRKDNTEVGSIGTVGGESYIGTHDTGLRFDKDSESIKPFNTATVANRDAAISLGGSAERFANLYLSGTSYSNFVQLASSGSAIFFENSNYLIQGSATNGYLRFLTNNNEAMRIDSLGDLLVGKTSSSLSTAGCSMKGSSNVIQSTRASGPALEINRLTSDGEVAKFYRETVAKGSISVNSSGTTYNTTSDIRLKTDIAPISDATDKLMAMNAVTHKWKAEPDADAVHGFIAQEMAEIVPEAVSGDPDGEKMMAMDYGRITPVIVAALQEANKKIAELETRIKELETK